MNKSSKSQQPYVAIVLLNWNGLDDTLACLKSLQSITYSNYKIVVIDNGSDNNEAAKIKKEYPNIHLIKNKKNLGFTGGCNQGIEYGLSTGANYILLLNNDTTVKNDFLTKLVSFYKAEPTAGVACSLILYPDKKTIWFAGGKMFLGITRHLMKGIDLQSANLTASAFKSDFVPGGCFLISSKLIKEIGKLDNRYFIYYEDMDWCYRAKNHGYFAYVVPDSIIYHKKSSSSGEGGKAKFSKVPAYLIARNGVWFASNLKGVKKAGYLISQVLFKMPASLILLVKPTAWGSYIKGLFTGFRDFSRVKSEY